MNDATFPEAERMLKKLEVEIARPAAFWTGDDGRIRVTDLGDVVLYAWNSVEYLETKDVFLQQLYGPIAVPRDGSGAFVLGTALKPEEFIAEWRKSRGA
ncbi:hypothetical protein GCM10009840_12900 [Pseudolysinimonas kribbensis]|uniref:Uncharacterized protein n=2 Tax=Pseudolysinimonas kribbensis TaxID=433641 RepID=A0ABQ6K526_9MICO|nr:hypothetical protein GCM10025881_25650 [Pseudolysinimonas kribbensis]